MKYVIAFVNGVLAGVLFLGFALLLSGLLAGCAAPTDYVVVTATPAEDPTPTREGPAPTPIPTQGQQNPHSSLPEFTSLNQFPSLVLAPVKDTAFDGRNFAYPQGYTPICNRFPDDSGGRYPCPYVFNKETGYQFEFNYVAGEAGLRTSPMPVYPGQGRYIVKAVIYTESPQLQGSIGAVEAVAFITSSSGVLLLPPQAITNFSGKNEFLWVIDAEKQTEVMVTFLIRSRYALKANTHILSVLSFETAKDDYGNLAGVIR